MVSSNLEVNNELIELLENLKLSPFTSHPVYKPTPIYPINHYLSSPCSVSYQISINFIGATSHNVGQNMPGLAAKVQTKAMKPMQQLSKLL